MISELNGKFENSDLKFFSRHLIKPEHLLGKSDSNQMYLKDYQEMMTPDLANQLLECNIYSLPFLPSEMISLDQVITAIKKQYPNFNIDEVKNLSMDQMKARCDIYQSEFPRKMF